MNVHSTLSTLQLIPKIQAVVCDQEEDRVELSHLASTLNAGLSADDLAKDFAIVESEYADSIDASIRAWSGDGRLPPLSPVEAAWRHMRFVAASGIVTDLLLVERPIGAILPSSGMTELDILKWLTIERWYSHGRRWSADAALRYGRQ